VIDKVEEMQLLFFVGGDKWTNKSSRLPEILWPETLNYL
jgi:hypothetical protein